jgi:hypothetical protein
MVDQRRTQIIDQRQLATGVCVEKVPGQVLAKETQAPGDQDFHSHGPFTRP